MKQLCIFKKIKNNKESLKIFKIIPFRNGNVQIGCFHHVLNGTTQLSDCKRGVINFSIKKKVLNHYYRYGTGPYDAYVKAGYPIILCNRLNSNIVFCSLDTDVVDS